MTRKTAGARYPHASSTARKHDHTWCPVVGAIIGRAGSGTEPWGTEHDMPALGTAEQAATIRQGLFRGRDCIRLRKENGAELSVSVTYRDDRGRLRNQPATRGGKYVLVVRVWPRKIAKQEIARRVGAGEKLHYNVLRSP